MTNEFLTLKTMKHCNFIREYLHNLQIGEKYLIISHRKDIDDHLLIFKGYNSLITAEFYNIRLKKYITLNSLHSINWEFLKIVKQKEFIQNAMEKRAINIILKRLIDDSFNY